MNEVTGSTAGRFHGAAGSVRGSRPTLQSSMLQVEFAQLSDSGKVREHNEDYLGYVVPITPSEARTRGWFFALADGVGGHAQGEVASQAAVETLLAGFKAAAAGEPLAALLGRLVQQANTRVFETALAAGRSGAGMATTLVCCSLRFDRVVVAHVGDSRCYLIRRGHATPLTRDHTFAGEQVRLGLLSAKEAADAPTRHVLSRSLGTELLVNVDTSEHSVLPGDVLLLCSDGLHGAVNASEMAAIVREHADLETAAHKLLSLANQKDGSDNSSVQLIRVRSVERMGTYRGLPYRLR